MRKGGSEGTCAICKTEKCLGEAEWRLDFTPIPNPFHPRRLRALLFRDVGISRMRCPQTSRDMFLR
jgi:hypothetical protein